MRIIRRLPGVLPTAVMVSCLVVTSVTAAPSQDSLEEQKSAAESEAEDLQAQLTELLDKVGKMEEKLRQERRSRRHSRIWKKHRQKQNSSMQT